MRPRSSSLGPRRYRCHPGVEGLEVREMPSTVPTGTEVVHIVPTTAPSFDPPASPVPSVFHQPLVPNLSLIPQFVQMDFPPSVTGIPEPQPTAQEIDREYYVAKFSGRYDVYPGRFSYQALTIHGISVDGGSNQSLHSRLNFAIYPPNPADPEPLTGQVSIVSQNYLQTGNLLLFDLAAPPAGQATGQSTENGTPQNVGNGISLPTHLDWDLADNSGSAYAAPQGFTQGGGYMDIVWIPDKHTVPGTLSSGRIVVLFQGLLNTSSVLNTIDPGIINQN
jgi:hypothetical protein